MVALVYCLLLDPFLKNILPGPYSPDAIISFYLDLKWRVDSATTYYTTTHGTTQSLPRAVDHVIASLSFAHAAPCVSCVRNCKDTQSLELI